MLISTGGLAASGGFSARSGQSGANSARSGLPRGGRSVSKNAGSFGSEGHVSAAWQADVIARLARLDQKIDKIDAGTQVLARILGANAANASKVADGLKLTRFNVADMMFEPPECPVPLAPGSISIPRGNVHGQLPTVSERSEASLPCPVGDYLMIEAPEWDPRLNGEDGSPKSVKVVDFADPTSLPAEGAAGPATQLSPKSRERSPGPAGPGGSRRPSVQSLEEVHLKNAARSKVREMLWNTLDDPESSRLAYTYARMMPYVIIFSVMLAILQTPRPLVLDETFVVVADISVEIIFSLEFVLRAISCPTKRVFFYDYNNVIDLLAAVPLAFRGSVSLILVESIECGTTCTILMCFVPVIRALKALRRFETLQLLIDASQRAAEGLPVCLFALFVLTLLFASLIYLVEPRDNIESLPHAMWLTIVTMTTVGYGDVTPNTLAGSLIVSVLVVISVLYMAMPLGIVGNAFSEVWQDRDFILLRHRTKTKLTQWGYAPTDVPALFGMFDQDQDGELNISDFTAMMDQIRIGLTHKRIVQLFASLDTDGGGTIDDREFVRNVFPEAFHTIYDGAA